MSNEQNLFEVAAAKLEAYNVAKAELEQAQREIQETVNRLTSLQANISTTLTVEGQPAGASTPESDTPTVETPVAEPVVDPATHEEPVEAAAEKPVVDESNEEAVVERPKKRATRRPAAKKAVEEKPEEPTAEPEQVDLFGDSDDEEDFDNFNF